jgi:hypothetical protein
MHPQSSPLATNKWKYRRWKWPKKSLGTFGNKFVGIQNIDAQAKTSKWTQDEHKKQISYYGNYLPTIVPRYLPTYHNNYLLT